MLVMHARAAALGGIAAALALAACYEPVINPGAPCDPGRNNCPTSQRCVAVPGGGGAGVCTTGGLPPGGPDAGQTGYAATVLADEPLAYWRLGDKTVVAVDASGNDAIGSYRGGVAQGTPGALVDDDDTSAAFDGASGVISVGNRFNFLGRAPFSIEAWLWPVIVDGVFRHAFTKQHRTTPREGYALLVQVDKGIMFERFVDDRALSVNVPGALPDSFVHVVSTYDGATLRLYIDGQLAAQKADDRPQAPIAEPALIGAASLAEQFFGGLIDEVAVYAVPLSDTQVREHYLAGAMPAEAR